MKQVLVTGGAVRVGAAIVEAVAQAGYTPIIHYRESIREAQHLASRFEGAETVHGDFSTAEGVGKCIDECKERFPHLYGLVNNVGNYHRASAMNTSPEELLALFQSNLFAPHQMIRALADRLKSVVNIGVAGIERRFADARTAPYTMTKGGLLMLTKSIALELAPQGVRVNMVSPGWVENSVEMPTQPLPMNRLATCAEVAEAVLFFMAEKNSYITGQNIEVSGGVRL